jgi:hypothetical protein
MPLSEALEWSRFESGFVILAWCLGRMMGAEAAVLTLSAATLAGAAAALHGLALRMTRSRICAVFAAAQAPIWYVLVDLSVNVLRSGLATTLLLAALLAWIDGRRGRTALLTLGAALLHSSALVVVPAAALAIALSRGRIARLLWAAWIMGLAVALSGALQPVVGAVIARLPLPPHQIAFLEARAPETPTQLIALVAMVGALVALSGLLPSIDDGRERARIAIGAAFLSTALLFFLLAGLPFSYRWAYAPLALAPAIAAALLAPLGTGLQAAGAAIGMTAVTGANLLAFGSVGEFLLGPAP